MLHTRDVISPTENFTHTFNRDQASRSQHRAIKHCLYFSGCFNQPFGFVEERAAEVLHLDLIHCHCMLDEHAWNYAVRCSDRLSAVSPQQRLLTCLNHRILRLLTNGVELVHFNFCRSQAIKLRIETNQVCLTTKVGREEWQRFTIQHRLAEKAALAIDEAFQSIAPREPFQELNVSISLRDSGYRLVVNYSRILHFGRQVVVAKNLTGDIAIAHVGPRLNLLFETHQTTRIHSKDLEVRIVFIGANVGL